MSSICCYILYITYIVSYVVFNQWGTNSSTSAAPEFCNCNTKVGGPGDGWTDYCNVIDLLLGLVIFPDNDPSVVLAMQSQVRNAELLNTQAYNASYATAAIVSAEANEILYDEAWRHAAFDFCRIPSMNNLTCTMIGFNIYDSSSTSITAYNYQLINGSCSNSVSLSNEAWEKLAEFSPTPLTEDYFRCTMFSDAALFNAVGIASGNVATAIPIAVVCLLPVLFIFLRSIGQVPPKEEYDKKELEDATIVLAKLLLRMRDGKTRGMKTNGALYHLTKELIEACRQEGW